MRFAELHLERYGRFEDCRLVMPAAAPDFHVIHGANEAGKSTTLAAVSDLLFGIPQRSTYNFRFDYPLMRVGGVIEEDGVRLACRRRKTREHSLVDADDQPIDEGRLLAMLGGLSRESFGTGYSLDQARLRLGGQAMVRANDDLGQALFAAGSGLTGVAAVQAALEAEADAIWGRRRAQRRSFTIAETQYDDSMRRQREQQLRPKEWTDARTAMVRQEDALATSRRRHAEVSAARRTAERLRRIGPAARQRAGVVAAVTELGAIVALTPQEEGRYDAALAALADATARRTLAERLHAEAADRLAMLTADPILHLADRIEALIERRGAIGKAETDRSRLSIERDGLLADAGALRREIGTEGDIPSRYTMTRLRTMLARHGDARTALRAREDALADVASRAEPLRRELADASLAEGLGELRAAIALARGFGEDMDARCAAGAEAAARAEADAELAFAQLLPWTGTADALARLPVLDEAEMQTAGDDALRWAARVDEAEAERRRLTDELEKLAAEAERLAATGQAVSADDLAAARLHRDLAWRDIAAHVCGGRTIGDVDESARSFETALAAADTIADRRYDTAEASAQLTALANARAERALHLDQAMRRAAEDEAALDATQAAWRDRLEAIALPPLAPARLRAWYLLRAAALERHRDAAERRRQASGDAERRADAIDVLARAMAAAPAARDRLAPILAAADRERVAGEALEQAFAEKRSRLGGLDDEAARLLRQLERDRRGMDEARDAWEAERATSGLTLGDGEGRLALVDELRTRLDAIQDREQRMRGIDADRALFGTEVDSLAAEAGQAVAGSASATLDRLRERLSVARSVAQSIAAAIEERDRRQGEVDLAANERDAALATLAPLLARAGAVDVVEAPGLIDRSRHRRRLAAALIDAEQAIVADGDGYPLDQLLTDWEACDPDEIANRAAALDDELATLEEAITIAADALGEARRTFAALDERPHGASDAAADAEAARAEMAAQGEAYIAKRVQSLMLRWAMDRYRERRQGPLLRRAGTLFATLTLGRFADLKVDYETAAPRLLGLRDDRTTLVPIEGMSEGTTDQLFLALRLAALEQSVAAGVRLPFLADDLFVNFDDDRAAAGFGILAEIARSTQVLFFTHHDHLRDIARAAIGARHLSECPLA